MEYHPTNNQNLKVANLLDTHAAYVGHLVISTFISSVLYYFSCCGSTQVAVATDVGYIARSDQEDVTRATPKMYQCVHENEVYHLLSGKLT